MAFNCYFDSKMPRRPAPKLSQSLDFEDIPPCTLVPKSSNQGFGSNNIEPLYLDQDTPVENPKQEPTNNITPNKRFQVNVKNQRKPSNPSPTFFPPSRKSNNSLAQDVSVAVATHAAERKFNFQCEGETFNASKLIKDVKRRRITIEQKNPMYVVEWTLPPLTTLNTQIILNEISFQEETREVLLGHIKIDYCEVYATITNIIQSPDTKHPKWQFLMKDNSSPNPLTVQLWDEAEYPQKLQQGCTYRAIGKVVFNPNPQLHCYWIVGSISSEEIEDSKKRVALTLNLFKEQ